MIKSPKFYRGKICLNVLGNSIENAKAIFEATEGHVLIGLLAKNYESIAEAVKDIKDYGVVIGNSVSVGLGAGDPKQCQMVAKVSKVVQPQHINQVFPYVGNTRNAVGQDETVVNALIAPTGKVGFVNISTGLYSMREEKQAIIPVEAAIAILKDMGGSSIKFYNMEGLKTKDEFTAIAKACADYNFAIEPTGGIDLNNFEEIVQIALDAGVKRVIPHVYSSIIDKETGDTRVEDVAALYEIVKKLAE